MFVVKPLILCVSILLPTIKSVPLNKDDSKTDCNRNTEKTSLLFAKMYEPADETFIETKQSQEQYCYRDKSTEDVNNVDSDTIRKKRDIQSIVMYRTWMGLPASFVITLVSVTLLVLNIALLLYILIRQGKLLKSKKNRDLQIIDQMKADFEKASQTSSVSSALSTPRMSDGYPSSCSGTEGNELSSLRC